MIKTLNAKLVKREQLCHDTFTFYFEIVNDVLDFNAGQYVIMLVKQNDGSVARRLYSIASPSTNNKGFELIVKRLPGGVASNYLASIRIGQEVPFQGPAGVFTLHENGKNKIFLATSTGIAPMLSMLQTQLSKGPFIEKWYLFWGVRTSHDLYYIDQLKDIQQKSPNFQYVICFSRETDVNKIKSIESCALGRIDACFNNKILDSLKANKTLLNSFDYYICGGINAVEDLRNHLLNAGVEKPNIFFEKFV